MTSAPQLEEKRPLRCTLRCRGCRCSRIHGPRTGKVTLVTLVTLSIKEPSTDNFTCSDLMKPTLPALPALPNPFDRSTPARNWKKNANSRFAACSTSYGDSRFTAGGAPKASCYAGGHGGAIVVRNSTSYKPPINIHHSYDFNHDKDNHPIPLACCQHPAD